MTDEKVAVASEEPPVEKAESTEAENTATTTPPTAEVSAKIRKQVEFYFSDSNLPRDIFLKKQVDKGGAEGWVDLDVIAKFARMKTLLPSGDVQEIAKIMREAAIVEISEDGTKIRRSPDHPLPMEAASNERFIYAKGWSLETTTIDSVEEYFTGKGYKVLQVRLRRMHHTKDFKGSVFVELDTSENAAKCASEEHATEEGPLRVMLKTAYHAMKAEERAKAKGKKGGGGSAKATDKAGALTAEEEAYVPGCLLKIEGLTAECSRETIKEALAPHGNVAWVDYERGGAAAEVRFDAANAAAIKTSCEEAGVRFEGAEPTFTVLEGDAEKAFYDRSAKERKEKRERSKSGGRGGKRSYGGGRAGSGKKRSDRDADEQPDGKRSKEESAE